MSSTLIAHSTGDRECRHRLAALSFSIVFVLKELRLISQWVTCHLSCRSAGTATPSPCDRIAAREDADDEGVVRVD